MNLHPTRPEALPAAGPVAPRMADAAADPTTAAPTSTPRLQRAAEPAGPDERGAATLKDWATLTKPAITRMCLLMTGAGLWLAPGTVAPLRVVGALLGTALAVGAANALNMWWERDADRRMVRTRDRPLAAGRIRAVAGLRFGLTLAAASIGVLATTTNLPTTLLGVGALLGYVLVYTPMKYRSPMALAVGAVPGAAPPLMGWTAVTGHVDPGGLVLFGVLLTWQMPHFIAIALLRRADYDAAGVRVVPTVRGEHAAKLQAVAWSVALLATSVLLTPVGVTGTAYLVVAATVGGAFLLWSIRGLRPNAGLRWARSFFVASLVYLPLLTVGFVLDRVIA